MPACLDALPDIASFSTDRQPQKLYGRNVEEAVEEEALEEAVPVCLDSACST